jgi:excisionase family DNA binding protein
MNIEKGVPMTFSVKEAGEIIGCSRSQVYVLINTRKLDSTKILGARRITESQLVRFLKKLEG